jgi:tetratricopeptide (TPR) repeat protein
LGESLELMKSAGLRQGEALMQMGVMTFTQLVAVLGKQTEFILQKLLTEREGTWAFHPLPGMPEQFLPPALRVPSLLFAALVKRGTEMRSDALAELHKPNMDSSVYIDERVRVVLAEIRMTPNEKKLVEIITSRAWRLREVFSVSPLSRQNTAAVILAMNELGFMQYRREADAARAVAALEEDVRRKKLRTEKATQFDIIEVHWISERHEVEEGYRKLVAAYTLDPKLELAADVRSDATVILQRAKSAYELLLDDARRREYRKKLFDAVTLQQSAELLSKRGEMAIMRKDRREALNCFSKALELMPTMNEYKEGLKRSQDIQVGG